MTFFSPYAETAHIGPSEPGADEPARDPLRAISAQLVRELRADAVVLGIDLGHGYRHETLNTAEGLPDDLARTDFNALYGHACHGRLTSGIARRREVPRSRITLLRAPGKPNFDAGCRKRLTLILPFVDHAVALACALETSHQAARNARILLDATVDAALLLTTDGRVLQATASARAMLETVGVRVEDRLTLPDPRLHKHFEMLLGRFRHPHAGARLHFDLLPGLRIALRAIDTRPGLFVLSITPVAGLDTRASSFAAQYGLTPCELKLSQALAGGMTLKECACRWNRYYETLRGQLKTLFSKTGCRRQAQLVVLYREHVPD
ncbi:MAG: helix-turn-helix transcriptional regulator [Pseudomonadota bacterium]